MFSGLTSLINSVAPSALQYLSARDQLRLSAANAQAQAQIQANASSGNLRTFMIVGGAVALAWVLFGRK